jgi:hypothetical protein
MVGRRAIQIIRKNELFFENMLHEQFEVIKSSTNGCFRLYIYLLTNKTLIHNPLCVFDNWGGGGGLSHKKDAVKLQ